MHAARGGADATPASPDSLEELGGGSAAAADGLPKVSHGASEKQRRDRINGMIDQLRVIGAPTGTRGIGHRAISACGAGGRAGR
jgi:hypothetical protein